MHRYLSLVALLPLLIFTSCTSQLLPPVSVFEKDLHFRPDSEDESVLVYRNPHFDITRYSKFIVAPVKIYSNESSRLSPTEEAALADGFRRELISSLENGYMVVESSDTETLILNTAIQDIQPAHVELDEDRFLVLRLDTLLARVAMELEGLDSVTGERVFGLIHKLEQKKYAGKDPAERLLNIQTAFGEWTRSLRTRFDKAKIRPKPGFDRKDIEEQRKLNFEEGQ